MIGDLIVEAVNNEISDCASAVGWCFTHDSRIAPNATRCVFWNDSYNIAVSASAAVVNQIISNYSEIRNTAVSYRFNDLVDEMLGDVLKELD
jgi:hypothetical protein